MKKATDPLTKSAALSTTPSPILPEAENLGKRFATIQARLALRGYAVRECTEGGWFVSRWNLAKFCRAIEDVEAFAREVGA